MNLQDFRTIEKNEELPMEILQEKEVDALDILEEKEVGTMNFVRPDTESDHMYYMSEDCLARQGISTEECIVPFNSEESEELLIDTTDNMEIN